MDYEVHEHVISMLNILICFLIIKPVRIWQSIWNYQHAAQCLALSEQQAIFVERMSFSSHLFYDYYVHIKILSNYLY